MDAFSYEDFSLFISALKFCAEKHRNQRRKDAVKTPYLNHPIEVAEILWTVGGVREMSILIAALLHDVIEDTETGPEEISSRFGDEVLSMVLEVTDDKMLPKSTRKELQVLHAPHLSHGAKSIKIADKIGNVRDVAWSPPPDWPMERRIEYLDWAERVVKGLAVGNEDLLDMFDKVLAEGKKELGAGK
jgi:GTP diphosphokinase / guanosine-3',5'-bis(diphosphate) 3'-diphosphatase